MDPTKRTASPRTSQSVGCLSSSRQSNRRCGNPLATVAPVRGHSLRQTRRQVEAAAPRLSALRFGPASMAATNVSLPMELADGHSLNCAMTLSQPSRADIQVWLTPVDSCTGQLHETFDSSWWADRLVPRFPPHSCGNHLCGSSRGRRGSASGRHDRVGHVARSSFCEALQ